MNRFGLFLADSDPARKLMSLIQVCWNNEEVLLGIPMVALVSNVLNLITIVIILCVLVVWKSEGVGARWWHVFDAIRGIIPLIIRTHYIAEMSLLQDLAEDYRKYVLFFCNALGTFWCSVIWLGYIWSAPLAYANASLVICIIHFISTIPSFKLANSLVWNQEPEGDSGYYDRLTTYRAPEVVQALEVPVDDHAYARNLESQYLRADQDQAYEDLLLENAKKQSLQVVPPEEADSSPSKVMPALSPLKPEATEGRIIKVRVRTLDGSVKTRNFVPKSTLTDIYKWLIKTEEMLPEFQLVTSYPRAVYMRDETTIEETGIIKNPSSDFDLSPIFAMEEKTGVENPADNEVEEDNREEA